MKLVLPFFALVLLFGSCKKKDAAPLADIEKDNKPITLSKSFYPMQVGNYWKADDQNSAVITDSTLIAGKLFYRFDFVISGFYITQYMRIDENQNLVTSFPAVPSSKLISARFSASVGDTFYDDEINAHPSDHSPITMVYKSDTKMVFAIGSSLPNVPTGNRTYYRGIGPDDKYKEIKITGRVYQYR